MRVYVFKPERMVLETLRSTERWDVMITQLHIIPHLISALSFNKKPELQKNKYYTLSIWAWYTGTSPQRTLWIFSFPITIRLKNSSWTSELDLTHQTDLWFLDSWMWTELWFTFWTETTSTEFTSDLDSTVLDWTDGMKWVPRGLEPLFISLFTKLRSFTTVE